MVRIVLKIAFLKLRYPKGLTGRVPLCPIMALDMNLSYPNDHCHREHVKDINNRFEFRPTDSGQVLKLLNKLSLKGLASINYQVGLFVNVLTLFRHIS